MFRFRTVDCRRKAPDGFSFGTRAPLRVVEWNHSDTRRDRFRTAFCFSRRPPTPVMAWELFTIRVLHRLCRQTPFMRPTVIPVSFFFQDKESVFDELVIGALHGCLAHTQNVARLGEGQRQFPVVAAIVPRVQFEPEPHGVAGQIAPGRAFQLGIGQGQVLPLAMSFALTHARAHNVILERGSIGHSWSILPLRSRRGWTELLSGHQRYLCSFFIGGNGSPVASSELSKVAVDVTRETLPPLLEVGFFIRRPLCSDRYVAR